VTVKKESDEYLDKYHSLTRRYTQLEDDCQKLQQMLQYKGQILCCRLVLADNRDLCQLYINLKYSVKNYLFGKKRTEVKLALIKLCLYLIEN